MSRSPSSFDNADFGSLLEKAGAFSPKKTERTSKEKTSSQNRVKRVRAVSLPSQRSLGHALKALLGELSVILDMPLFVADDDGLLLAGIGDLPTVAASLAADAIRSLKKQASYKAGNIDALLLKATPKDYMVFSRQYDERIFIVGAMVTDDVPLEALRAAAELTWETLFTRI